jgi:hypothetical protein
MTGRMDGKFHEKWMTGRMDEKNFISSRTRQTATPDDHANNHDALYIM